MYEQCDSNIALTPGLPCFFFFSLCSYNSCKWKSDTSVYYTEHKPKNEIGEAWDEAGGSRYFSGIY